ncbi:hypothetical protein GWI33_023382, partial [Rhynchophorus ferrugineus]
PRGQFKFARRAFCEDADRKGLHGECRPLRRPQDISSSDYDGISDQKDTLGYTGGLCRLKLVNCVCFAGHVQLDIRRVVRFNLDLDIVVML